MENDRRKTLNRRNARRSTGPRSSDGKRRASRNSYRHGCASSGATLDPIKVKKLAEQIYALTSASDFMELARAAAEAQLLCQRVRLTKIAVIKRIVAFGESMVQEPFLPKTGMIDYLMACLALRTLPGPAAAAPMPPSEPERSTEGIMREFHELRLLDRYEAQAIARRDRALRLLLARTTLSAVC